MEKDNCFIKWENWTAMCKIMKLEHSLTSCIKINPKWIKELNVRLDIIKLIEENIGRRLFEMSQQEKKKRNITARFFLIYLLE